MNVHICRVAELSTVLALMEIKEIKDWCGVSPLALGVHRLG